MQRDSTPSVHREPMQWHAVGPTRRGGESKKRGIYWQYVLLELGFVQQLGGGSGLMKLGCSLLSRFLLVLTRYDHCAIDHNVSDRQ